ncbi:hypothetical protein ABBQ38_010074 [Trebouxia sp. C0009 RCD-2024]
MERSRKLRATSRPPSELTASVNAGNGAGSSEDEDYEVPSAPVPQRASTRRQPKVDFSKLDATSLKKYRKLHDMEDLPPGASKEDMIPAVAKHFSQQVVDEKDTLVNFALSLKRHYLQTRHSPQQPIKKARNASKVKAR